MVLRLELLQHLVIITFNPARGGNGNRFDDRLDSVFALQSMDGNVELQPWTRVDALLGERAKRSTPANGDRPANQTTARIPTADLFNNPAGPW